MLVDVGCICLFVFKLYKGGNFVTIQVAFIIQTVLLVFMTASDSALKKKKKNFPHLGQPQMAKHSSLISNSTHLGLSNTMHLSTEHHKPMTITNSFLINSIYFFPTCYKVVLHYCFIYYETSTTLHMIRYKYPWLQDISYNSMQHYSLLSLR